VHLLSLEVLGHYLFLLRAGVDHYARLFLFFCGLLVVHPHLLVVIIQAEVKPSLHLPAVSHGARDELGNALHQLEQVHRRAPLSWLKPQRALFIFCLLLLLGFVLGDNFIE
jgi:hypothetical protein